ncbi:MAG: type II toxin-antitoxin system VapC family toxin [Xanthomonadales bacterium]|nr:type II toxin-antitoxin system VapC family toxin [Xanthomonadales bacterium]
MITIDTNVLVRLLTGDHPVQSRASRALFASEDIFIPDTVWLETEWVLRAAYDLSRDDIGHAFKQVCGLPNVRVNDARRLAQIIDWHLLGFDFADAFHLATSQPASTFKTFDARFIKNAKRHTARQVERA